MRIAFIARSPGYEQFLEQLKPRLPGHQFQERFSRGQPAEVLISAGGVVDRALLEIPELRLVQTLGTGYENVDVEAAAELGVWACNLRASATGNAESVAEHSVLLMLALARGLHAAEKNLRAKKWAAPRGLALKGKQALIVGFGDVGLALAERLIAMGMKVVATRRDTAKGAHPGVELHGADELPALLPGSDHVIVCARASPENKDLIGAKALAAMKQGAFLINVSRGSLVDLGALQAALASGHLGGAGLDVFPQEPMDSSHTIFQLENVVATPHVAGVTDMNAARSLELVAENVERLAKGQGLRFNLNTPRQPRKKLDPA